MSSDYDAIAEEYQRSKLQPWRRHIEVYTVLNLVGDPSGLSVLDLACGEGFYTRLLRRKGAARAVGVDLSAGMIDLARREETERPLAIEYIRQDAATLALDEGFDLVFAAYLLNYAETRETLLSMCRTIARHLKPGGRFVGINSHPDYSGTQESMRQYGFTRDPAPAVEGTPFTARFFQADGQSFEITNYYLSIPTHEWAFAQAGLGKPHWHFPKVSPDGIQECGAAFWADFLAFKPIVALECVKSGAIPLSGGSTARS